MHRFWIFITLMAFMWWLNIDVSSTRQQTLLHPPAPLLVQAPGLHGEGEGWETHPDITVSIHSLPPVTCANAGIKQATRAAGVLPCLGRRGKDVVWIDIYLSNIYLVSAADEVVLAAWLHVREDSLHAVRMGTCVEDVSWRMDVVGVLELASLPLAD